jgi:site-specific recombinase XerD
MSVSSEVMQPNSKVIQLLPEVIQPEGLNNFESHLQELESEIKELKSLIFRGFAINSVRHVVDLRRLQQVLGHTNINRTAVYLQFNDQDLQDVYANVPF